MIARLAVVLVGLALGMAGFASAACSGPDPPRSAKTTSGTPVQSPAAAAEPETPDPSALPRSGSAVAPDNGRGAGDQKNVLTGRWKLVMGSMTWLVRLAPRPGLPGEYIGMGRRETPDENGKAVTMEVAAVVDQGARANLRAWLGLSVIKCAGPYLPPRVTIGTCTEIGGDPGGPFRAERIAGDPEER